MLIDALFEAAQRHPQKVAVQDSLRQLSYEQLIQFAATMRRFVLSKTSCPRVGIMLPASVAGMASTLGVLWAGRTVVPLNFLLQPPELATIVADAQIDLVISTRHFENILSHVPIRTLYLEKLYLKTRFLWEKLHRLPSPPKVSPNDWAAIVYTSGSTGQPKGVCLSYRNLLFDARQTIEHLCITEDAHLLGVLPPFHIFGLTVLMFVPILLGAQVTFIPRFSPQAAAAAITAYKTDIVVAVPSMYAAIARLKNLDKTNFAHVRVAASGGEPLSKVIYDSVLERTGMRLIEGYGLTETSPVISADQPWNHRVGTVGKPLAGVEIQLRDENGQWLPLPVAGSSVSVEGELFVRGPLVMQGYFNRPEETAIAVDSDGWFRTGDIVRVDDDGHIAITGRAKDMIIVGGENVYPREIESVLEEHPAVAEAAAVGRPDSHRGEVVVAFVSLKEGWHVDPVELRAFCRDRLASFKVPREVVVQADLPRGPTGKINKRLLREPL